MKATAIANTNIALIKYWGKRDNDLFLPTNSSLSITLDGFNTKTSVEFRKELKQDRFVLNDTLVDEKERIKITRFLDKVRDIAGVNLCADIVSYNNVPTAAGFASSASGYAALTAAATKALNMNISHTELSIIARQGSGSACRSIFGGFALWNMGRLVDGSDSYAQQILSEKDWKFSILSTVISSRTKKISSREGMERTVNTSPFYKGWLDSSSLDLVDMKKAITDRDFVKLGEISERNALKMHATMLGANPPILYWESGTIEVINLVHYLRDSGIPVYFTIDAGANVKILCPIEEEEKVRNSLKELKGIKDITSCYPGEGIRYV